MKIGKIGKNLKFLSPLERPCGQKANMENINCNVCKSNFLTEHEMKRHKKTVHEESKSLIKCNKCNATFKQEIQLKRHVTTVHEKKETVQM